MPLLLLGLMAASCGEAAREAGTLQPRETLSVEQAFKSNATGRVRVRGILFADARDVRLCSAILESHPPQCGRPSLVVRGLDLVGVSNMEQAKGVRWTSREATLVGEVDDGVLTVAR